MKIRHLFAATAKILLALTAAAAADEVVRSAVLRVERDAPLPLSRLDLPTGDEGVMGARVATADNNTTGRFIGHTYEMTEVSVSAEGAVGALDALIDDGVRYVAVMADADTLLALADHAAGRDVVLFNTTATETRLRSGDCRANVFHTAPSRAMLADGLAQYLVWKKWSDWVLVTGSNPPDMAMAEAFRRSATKFGARIVEERVFEDTGGARRTDTGHVLVQRQIPVFMQDLDDHHVVVVADESEVFGEYLPYRTWDARPVAGNAGLTISMWHPAHESYGSTQLQRRFERTAGRRMTDADYNVWMALRSLGEAVTRAGSGEPADVVDYLRGPEFQLAGFKGPGLSYRPWNNQLRQGVLLGDGKLVVSISPQQEFLHQRTRLDTLGLDEPESECRL